MDRTAVFKNPTEILTERENPFRTCIAYKVQNGNDFIVRLVNPDFVCVWSVETFRLITTVQPTF